MARDPSPRRRTETHQVAGRVNLAGVLEAVAFAVIILLVAIRPLTSETYDAAMNSISQASGDLSSPTPATTAFFDLLIWLSGILVAAAVLLRRRSWQLTGLELGWGIMAAGAVVSSWAASNRRLAINASCDWLSAIVLTTVLANVLHTRKRVVLLLAVVAASGLASALKCGTWAAWEYDDAWRIYQDQKEQFWVSQGIDISDSRVELYERRMQSREATGFLAFSNSQGAGLLLAGFAAFALAGMAGRDRGTSVLCGVLGAISLLSITLTKSRGAMGAALASLVILAAGAVWRQWLGRNWKTVLLAGWGLAIAGSLAVASWGLFHGRLPGDSLKFRWDYWRVTSRMIAERPWTGTGALNFDRVYMMHKPIEYPEEIRDPHNFVMAIVSQWGILGGAGLLMTMVGGSWLALRRFGRQPVDANGSSPDRNHLAIWIATITLGFVLLRAWMLRSWWAGGESGMAAAYFDLLTYVLAWILAFVGMALFVGRQPLEPTGATPDDSRCAAVPSWPRLVCLAALVGFLLHNTIDFSLFVPGTLTTFAAMAALVVAGCEGRRAGGGRAAAWLTAGIFACGLLAVSILVVFPVVRASTRLDRARRAMPAGYDAPDRLYREAAKADPLDPAPLLEAASWQAHTGGLAGLDRALDYLSEAGRRDPLDRSIHRHRWQILLRRYETSRASGDLLEAVRAAEKAVELYPESPDGRMELARILGRVASDLSADAGAEVAGRDWLAEAAACYRRALDLDAMRPAYEIRRWPAERRRQVENELSDLMTAAGRQGAR